MHGRDLLLLPRPRRLATLDGNVPADAPVRVIRDPGRRPQGYAVLIADGRVEIRHRDAAGRRYAEGVLRQIRDECPDRLPSVRIDDWPDFPVRAYMLDVSRDRVPTRETLERLVELLQLCRYNQLQLYMEHTFAYRSHEAVWRDASPLTPDDLRWLDGLCRAAGIELVANQNCFGHMERWLRHPAYRWRAECPEGAELLPGVRMPPSVLAPTEANASFVLELLEELLANFTSRRVHIGCDETFELGMGASAAEVASRGRARVWAEHVGRIARPLAAAGFEILCWADVARREPEVVRDLPDRLIPVAWTYEAPGRVDHLPPGARDVLGRLGIDAAAFAGFDANVAPLARAGIGFWVAPGTSAWNSLVGRIDNARANLLDAAEVGLRHGSTGYLVTDWGDNGHIQPPSVSWPALALGGAVAWCAASNADLDLAAVCDRFLFRDAARSLGDALLRAGRQWARTGQVAFNASPLQAALFPAQAHLVTGEPDLEKVQGVTAELDVALEGIARARPLCPDGPLVQRELVLATRLARHGALRLLARAGGRAPDRDRLRAELIELAAEQRACWLARSRPGGLADSMRHFESALASYGD